MVAIEVSRDAGDVTEAAQIWAAATSARRGDSEVPGLDISRPLIQGVLDQSPRALLLMARAGQDASQDARQGLACGFAAVRPLDDADAAAALVSFFGVRPGLWGQGLGEALLRALPEVLTAAGFTRAELLVYADNGRAVRLYERLGWRRRGEPVANPRTGKPMNRYELTF